MAGHDRTTGIAGHCRAWPDNRTTGHGNTTTRSPHHRHCRTWPHHRHGRTWPGMAGPRQITQPPLGRTWPDLRTAGQSDMGTGTGTLDHYITGTPVHPTTTTTRHGRTTLCILVHIVDVRAVKDVTRHGRTIMFFWTRWMSVVL